MNRERRLRESGVEEGRKGVVKTTAVSWSFGLVELPVLMRTYAYLVTFQESRDVCSLRQTDLLRGSGGNYRAAQWVLGRSTCAHYMYVCRLVPGRWEVESEVCTERTRLIILGA